MLENDVMATNEQKESRDAGQKMFAKGAIISIELENFLTYSKVKINNGPRLNLILGPNGSGKSSIVAAINLALGGNTGTIGRSKDVRDYIQYGKKSAQIIIELYDEEEGNLIVRYVIRREGPHDFYMGRPGQVKRVKRGQVIELLKKKYHVQLDNPCQFLAQDKVTEFARQDPKVLLKNTLNAVGTEEQISSYNELMERMKNGEEEMKEVAVAEAEVEEMGQRLKADTPKYQLNRDQLRRRDKIHSLDKKIAYLELLGKEEEAKATRAECKKIQLNIRERKAERQPQLQKRKEKISQVETLRTQLTVLDRKIDEEDKMIKRGNTSSERLVDTLRNLSQELAEKQGELKKTEDELEQQKTRLNNLIQQRNDNQQSLDLPELKKKAAAADLTINKYGEKLETLRRERNQIEHRNNELEQRAQDLRRRREREWSRNERLNTLGYKFQHVGTAWKWYLENRESFKGLIHIPLLCIDCESDEAAKYLENSVAFRDQISFVCELDEDAHELAIVARQNKWKINIAVPNPANVTPVKINDELRQLGLTSVLSDHFTAPDHVKRHLCQVTGMQTILIGNQVTEDSMDEVYEILDQLSRDGRSRFNRFMTPFRQVMLKKSAYSGELSKRDGPLRDAKNLQKPSVQKIQDKVQFDLQMIEGEKRELEGKRKEITSSIEQIRPLIVEATDSKTRCEEQMSQGEALQYSIASAKKRVAILERIMKDADVSGQEQAVKGKAEIMSIQKDFAEEMRAAKKMETLVRERLIKSASISEELIEVKHMDKWLVDFDQEISSLERSLKQAEIEATEKAKERVEQEQRLLAMLGLDSKTSKKEDREKAFVEENFPAMSLSELTELEEERALEQTEYNMRDGVNADFIHNYKTQQAQYHKAKAALEARIEQQRESVELAKKMREEFLAPVYEMVGKINENFARFLKKLDYSGTVTLNSGSDKEDISGYGIEIQVKFRESGKLRRLTAQTQSGGERSVSTIIYMLSLQELSKVPFRAVDEINQGMDATNERRVFQLMVGLLTGEDESANLSNTQYFMLTPKLLPDLQYGNRMEIHTVMNGVTNEVSSEDWNVESFIKRARKIAAR